MTYANDSPQLSQQLSALADNELDAPSIQALLLSCSQDSQLMDTWASYHTIGDVLRANSSDGHAQVPQGVLTRPTSVISQTAHAPAITLPPAAANDSVFRWKMVAGVAAVAAVGSILWATVGAPAGAGGAQLAQVSVAPPMAVASGDVIMIRDPRLDDLLAAHKQFGGASALQQPAGFLRNATFQSAGR